VGKVPRRLLALFLLLALTGCATRAEREAVFDKQLREMSGSSESRLLGGMGRIPDSSYQLEDGTKILQWRWDTSYIDPGMAGFYPRYGGWGRGWPGGFWAPMGGFPPTLVRQSCIVEWTMANGSAVGYRWQGNGCQKITAG